MAGNGNPKLREFLAKSIEASGPMPFDQFMRHCLYHPDWGYYASGENHTGRKGDFYTNISVGPVFGQLLSIQFVEMWEKLGEPADFTIVEQGANDGQFAFDVLEAIHRRQPRLAANMRYLIIEPQPLLEKKQKEKLSNYSSRVQWRESLSLIENESISGAFFSNELPDSFPVKIMIYQNGCWMENCVTWDEKAEEFEWVPQPSEESITRRAEAFPKIENYTTEICLYAEEWMTQVARILKTGFVITVDYGHTAESYRDPSRTEGTLLCYHHHQQTEDPLTNVGEQDITAHVDFTQLENAGTRSGLRTLGLLDQHKFLVGVAKESLLQAEGCTQTPAFDIRGFKTLMHPEILGTTFKFLVQSKNIEENTMLLGLAHF